MVKVFLSYSRKDIEAAKRLFDRLKVEAGVEPWFDKANLLPGLKWQPAIRKAIREADYFIALISSRSTSKRGYVQSELKLAMEVLKEFPENEIYLIPVRLDDCEMPLEDLREINYVDLFTDWAEGVASIIRVIKAKIPTKQSTIILAAESSASAIVGTSTYQYRVGICDIDVGLSNVKDIAQRLNSVQGYFHFTCPTLPKLLNSVSNFGGFPNFDVHRVPDSFYSEHRYLAVDLVTCLTKYPLAFREGNRTLYNYFSGPGEKDKRFNFVSTSNLYEYCKSAHCTFEKGIVHMIVGQLVVYFTKFGYHPETRGCVMDFCENRADMIQGLSDMKFCDDCNSRFGNSELRDALNLLISND